MSDKIFLRIGSWYRANEKLLSGDIDITGLIVAPSAEYPVAKDPSGEGGSETLDEVLANGNDAGGGEINNINIVSFSEGGGVFMTDTATQTLYKIVITNGALVLVSDF